MLEAEGQFSKIESRRLSTLADVNVHKYNGQSKISIKPMKQ